MYLKYAHKLRWLVHNLYKSYKILQLMFQNNGLKIHKKVFINIAILCLCSMFNYWIGAK